jgi:hypothetical protein
MGLAILGLKGLKGKMGHPKGKWVIQIIHISTGAVNYMSLFVNGVQLQ